MRNVRHFDAVSIENAVALLGEYGADARIITGGVDIVGLIKNRVFEPKALVNIKGVPGLKYIREDGDFLRIGALTTISEIESSDLIKARYPMLFQAAHGWPPRN